MVWLRPGLYVLPYWWCWYYWIFNPLRVAVGAPKKEREMNQENLYKITYNCPDGAAVIGWWEDGASYGPVVELKTGEMIEIDFSLSLDLIAEALAKGGDI